MSRFANPAATKPFAFRDCACPGRPHKHDWLEIRSELGEFELAELNPLPGPARLRKLIVSWNLLDDDGQTAPITDDYLARMFGDQFDELNDWIQRNVRVTALPKGRAARWLSGLRAAFRITRTTPTRP